MSIPLKSVERINFRLEKNKVNNFTHPSSSNRLGYPFAYTTHTTIVPKSMNRCVRTLDEPRLRNNAHTRSNPDHAITIDNINNLPICNNNMHLTSNAH